MKISRIFHGGKTMLRRLTIFLLCGALLVSSPSDAQNRDRVAAPSAPAVAPLPAAPNIGILLLAFDELPAPDAVLPAAPAIPEAQTPPEAPPGAITGAITPANAPSGAKNGSFWVAQAQIAPDEMLPVAPLSPLPPGGVFRPLAPPGRAQLAAVPLRRALMALGWRDVLPAAPDAPTVTRALGERTLTPRTLDSLKLALSQLAASRETPPSPELTARAALLASRVGQALGYRAVVALHVAPATPADGPQNTAFSLLLADSERETAQPHLFNATGDDDAARRDNGAQMAAALLDTSLRAWPPSGGVDRAALATRHLEAARAARAAGNVPEAQDELTQAIALDPQRAESYILLGDLLSVSDVAGAALAYRRAVELNARDGETWAKIAIAATTGALPDWPRALDAGRKAIETSYDSVPLRVAMATAQFGRAELFRKANRVEPAEDAEIDARKHLDRALELAPDDPAVVRLLARGLVASRRFSEAAQILDRIAPRYPNDLEIQRQYATALTALTGREEDAFAAYARTWNLSGQKSFEVNGLGYRTLAQGFDARVDNLGKLARQITNAVATGALPREDALLQLAKLKEEMSLAQNAIAVLRAPNSIAPESAAARVFAADLMDQALEQQQIYLETGQEIARTRGYELNRQAILRLNAARTIR
ncbi:MAG: tetratricopeptide repeat protein [Armatimonadetes bacterium]|nr:tetratricopeptide repeat protein [Armatimonadota bacterium]